MYDVFNFGPDKMERIKDVIYNPFWSDFIISVDALFKTDIITHMDIIHETPLWFNPNLRIDFLKSWYDKGIRKINELVDTYGRQMELHNFQETFQVKSKSSSTSKIFLILKQHFQETAISI